METEARVRVPLKETLGKFREYDPKIIPYFVPANKEEQQRLFMRGEVRNPDHVYAELEELDIDKNRKVVDKLSAEIISHPDVAPKFAPVYEAMTEGYHKNLRLLELAREYKAAEHGEKKEMLREAYMRLNIEAYGEPDEPTYRALLREKLEEISAKTLSSQGEEIRNELFGMIDRETLEGTAERFEPAEETVRWVSEAAMHLYGGMLAHIPAPEEKEGFTPDETRAIFQEIIDEEFGEAAAGWEVVVGKKVSITVMANEKQITIPRDRLHIDNQELRGLVAHELGVHMLRTVMGEMTDLEPLGHGLRGYYDSEEGLGMVMGQAVKGKFTVSGKDHYITAGAAYFDGMNFREAFEMKWRLRVLEEAGAGRVISNLAIAEAKKKAYVETSRCFRGTDDLPWFKDLAYYNGTVDMWRYLESIRGDDTKFMFVLLGKGNPANIEHERIMYETATK